MAQQWTLTIHICSPHSPIVPIKSTRSFSIVWKPEVYGTVLAASYKKVSFPCKPARFNFRSAQYCFFLHLLSLSLSPLIYPSYIFVLKQEITTNNVLYLIQGSRVPLQHIRSHSCWPYTRESTLLIKWSDLVRIGWILNVYTRNLCFDESLHWSIMVVYTVRAACSRMRGKARSTHA